MHSTDASNYRPILVLQIFSKIFEKIVYKPLYTYLEQNNILYEHQCGFRKHRYIVQALLNHMEFMMTHSGHFVLSLFLDFKKAFNIIIINTFLAIALMLGTCIL